MRTFKRIHPKKFRQPSRATPVEESGPHYWEPKPPLGPDQLPMDKYGWSKHAVERCVERGIAIVEAITALEHPDYVKTGEDGKRNAYRGDVRVVLDGNEIVSVISKNLNYNKAKGLQRAPLIPAEVKMAATQQPEEVEPERVKLNSAPACWKDWMEHHPVGHVFHSRHFAEAYKDEDVSESALLQTLSAARRRGQAVNSFDDKSLSSGQWKITEPTPTPAPVQRMPKLELEPEPDPTPSRESEEMQLVASTPEEIVQIQPPPEELEMAEVLGKQLAVRAPQPMPPDEIKRLIDTYILPMLREAGLDFETSESRRQGVRGWTIRVDYPPDVKEQ